MGQWNIAQTRMLHRGNLHVYMLVLVSLEISAIIAGSLESAYSLIWGSHKIWGKGGGDTLDLL